VLSAYAEGDLMQPAHNKLYLRLRLGQPIKAVPLGCGQLASGDDCGCGTLSARLV